MCLFRILLCLALVAAPAAVAAQGAQVAFGSSNYDSSLPVEISADQLQVNQTDGSARFTGNVVIGQGDMRLTGAVVDVTYATAGDSQIEKLDARGGVTLVTGAEAAEAEQAVYTLADGVVVMTGDVILTQGRNAMAGEKLTVNLDDGTGVMTGRVRVVFQQDEKP